MKRLHKAGKWGTMLIWGIVCALMLSVALPAAQVQASDGINSGNAFENLEGDAQFLGKKYRDHYTLDIEETGVLEKHFEAVNGIANALFFLIRYMSYATVTLFYYALEFDMGELFGGQINGIQQALKDTIFEPLLLLACGICLVSVAIKFIKGNITGSVVEFCKIILVCVLAMFVVLKSDVALSQATSVTKEVSVDALASVNDSMGMSGSVKDFAAEAAGVLWVDLVHEPWKTAEFLHTDVSDDVVKTFLSEGDEDRRAKLVEDFEDADCFKMSIGFERVGFLLIYLIPCLAKCVLYVAVAGALLIFQILAVFYLILAPVMLLMFLIAGYERILTAWLKKMLETQIMILVIMMMLALLIRTDIFLFKKAEEWGWFIALLIQLIMGAGLFLNRGRIFELLSTVQRGVATPGYAANRLRMGGSVVNIRKEAAAAGNQIRQRATASMRTVRAMKKKIMQIRPVSLQAPGAPEEPGALHQRAGQENRQDETGRKDPVEGTKKAEILSKREMALQAGRLARAYMKKEKNSAETGKPGTAAGRAKDVAANVKDTLRIPTEKAGDVPLRFQYSAMPPSLKGVRWASGLQSDKSNGRDKKDAENGQRRVKNSTKEPEGKQQEGVAEKNRRRRPQSQDTGRGKRPAYREGVGRSGGKR